MARWIYPSCALLALAACAWVTSLVTYTAIEEVCLTCGARSETRQIDFRGQVLSRSVRRRPPPIEHRAGGRPASCGHHWWTLLREVSRPFRESDREIDPARWGVNYILDRPLGWQRLHDLDPWTATDLLYLHVGTDSPYGVG